MPAYTRIASGTSSTSQPMNVIPCCLRIIAFLRTAIVRSVYLLPDPVPAQRPAAVPPVPALPVPIEPDSGRLADQILFRHESPYPAVGAVVAIIADHQIMARRYDNIPGIAGIRIFAPGALIAHIAAVDVALAACHRRHGQILRRQA